MSLPHEHSDRDFFSLVWRRGGGGGGGGGEDGYFWDGAFAIVVVRVADELDGGVNVLVPAGEVDPDLEELHVPALKGGGREGRRQGGR